MTFGSFIKEKRLNLNIGLREFIEATGFNPTVWNAIERDMTYLKDPNIKVDKISEVLQILKDSDDYITLKKLALECHNTKYPKIDKEKFISEHLPVYVSEEIRASWVDTLDLFVDNINSLNGYTDENPKIKK